ncbi:TRAP transporter small permease [Natronincola ferrireducens]|uniref:TRAP-type C4-dicarboxylate transport system, small permease component n=1 Tax=Natronincola ferrireducens TaxID=393762 RepID=A0A1G9IWJ4_9FIRM|nr:TRAP transporter small permease [Natronincola ferrireducens]SDL29577.1 TRAP-type C4-dicarboxylate transport system, small permease component [Natronincola ferrireducens]
MKAINSKLEKLFLFKGAILLSIFVIVVFMEVITRNYLKISVRWASEVALFCFVWSVFLGSAVAVRKRCHYVVEIFPPKFKKINAVLDIVGSVAMFGVIYIMVVNGYTFTKLGLLRYSTALSLPQAYFYVSIPLSGIAMALFTTEVLIEDINKFKNIVGGGNKDESINSVNE